MGFFCFNNNLGDILCATYPGVKSVKNFRIVRSKSMLSANQWLAPYFKTSLLTTLKMSEILSYSFHESLNEVIQTPEINLVSDFLMVKANISKWSIIILLFLDIAATLTYWISLLDWLKTSSLNVYNKSPWMTILWIWSFFKTFRQNLRMKIIIHLLI